MIIGGLMVYLHGARVGRQPGRITEDVDVVFDPRVQTGALRQAVARLGRLGYEVDGMSPDGIAHRYVRDDGMKVDLLAPNGLGERADLTTTPPGRTVEVLGGRAALQNSFALPVSYSDRTTTIQLPDLPRALVIKARAFEVSPHDRHLTDIAFMCSLIDDPDSIHLSTGERRHLALARVLDDLAHPAWRTLGDQAEDAHQAWLQLRHG